MNFCTFGGKRLPKVKPASAAHICPNAKTTITKHIRGSRLRLLEAQWQQGLGCSIKSTAARTRSKYNPISVLKTRDVRVRVLFSPIIGSYLYFDVDNECNAWITFVTIAAVRTGASTCWGILAKSFCRSTGACLHWDCQFYQPRYANKMMMKRSGRA